MITWEMVLSVLPTGKKLEECYLAYRPWLRDKTHTHRVTVAINFKDSNNYRGYYTIYKHVYGATKDEAIKKMYNWLTHEYLGFNHD